MHKVIGCCERTNREWVVDTFRSLTDAKVYAEMKNRTADNNLVCYLVRRGS